jgi:hypothetical protein
MSMRVRKAKKSPRSIRYLLYADQRLQRISLKRISERLKKAKRPPRSKTAGSAPKRVSSPFSAGAAIVLAAICVVGAAALIAARQPSPVADRARVAAPIASAVSEAAATATFDNPHTRGVSTRIPAAPQSVDTLAVKSTVEPPAAESASQTAALDSTAKSDVQDPPVTITGCLERDDDTFWLEDTAGAGAPKSRSWRSGFLRKRPSRIALVDAQKTLKLPGYVGDRVAATGTLMNREMHARSLRRVAESCD